MADQFLDDIRQRLQGKLDPDEFERCVVELLGPVFPGIVPIPGGKDGGMDGAIPDGKGPAFPLVVTTSKRPKDNLKTSLSSYKKRGGRRTIAVFATSREVRKPLRDELEELARGQGFELTQVFGRDQLAALLYRRPDLCSSLLNLSSRPPALSAVPEFGRPSAGELEGRAEELAWLSDTKGDRLLLGLPGSGKTFLLWTFQKNQAGAFFLASDDEDRISEAIRQERPQVVIIDDAHLETRRRRLDCCRRLRAASGLDFKLVVASWASESEELIRVLEIPSTNICSLSPLKRGEIEKVVRAAGLRGAPTPLVRELVDQAEGRPGLATTLARFCLAGDWNEVFLGNVLRRYLMPSLEGALGAKSVPVLAVLSLGGNAGLPVDLAGELLGIGPADIWQLLSELQSAGVIEPARRADHVQVRPPALRAVLVREFFAHQERLLERAVALTEGSGVLGVLIDARAIGAPVSLLESLLKERGGRRDVWAQYAYLGPREALNALENHPEQLLAAAGGILHYHPERGLIALLDVAVGDQRPLNQAPDHPLRQLEDWVHSARPGTGEAVPRRQFLARTALSWAGGGGDVGIGVKAFCLALAPGFETREMDVTGRTMTLTSGLLTPTELTAVTPLWDDLTRLLKDLDWTDWVDVLHTVSSWLSAASRYRCAASEEHLDCLRAGARRAVEALVELQPGPGVVRRLNRWRRELGLDPLPVDEVFEALFPPVERLLDQTSIKELAEKWKDQDPLEIVRLLAKLEQEAREAGAGQSLWPIARELSHRVERPMEWLKAFLRVRPDPGALSPFLEQVAKRQVPGWEAFAEQLYDQQPQLRGMITMAILAYIDPASPFYEHIENGMVDTVANLDVLASRKDLKPATVARLLSHPDGSVRAAAVAGEWLRTDDHRIRDEVRQAWRDAVLSFEGDGNTSSRYWLGEILEADRELSHDWLARRLQDQYPWRMLSLDQEDVLRKAAAILENEQRMALLKVAPDDLPPKLFELLVGDELEVYKWFLEQKASPQARLAPLAGRPVGVWADKARLALEAGHTAHDVLSAAYTTGFSWVGRESNMWQECAEAFAAIEQQPQLEEVGRLGREHAEANRRRALEQERQEEVYGHF